LTFDRELLGAENKARLFGQSLCIKGLPRSVSGKQLHEAIDKEDKKVKTLKISLDENYRSNQYAFVTF
jgi:hypothetical protein